MDKTELFEYEDVSVYRRDGKWYWTIKSKAFDTLEEAAKNASAVFETGTVEKTLSPSEAAEKAFRERVSTNDVILANSKRML